MTRYAVLLIFLSGFFFAFAASADESEGYAVPRSHFSSAERVKLAQTYKTRIVALDSAIPELSPSQQEWLEREYEQNARRGGNINRALAAMESLEYKLKIAKDVSSANRDLIERLAQSEFSDHRQELALWISLALNLLNQDATHALIDVAERGVVDMRLTNDQHSPSANVAASVRYEVGYRIFGEFILPYFTHP